MKILYIYCKIILQFRASLKSWMDKQVNIIVFETEVLREYY
jgi:hypothetical protein